MQEGIIEVLTYTHSGTSVRQTETQSDSKGITSSESSSKLSSCPECEGGFIIAGTKAIEIKKKIYTQSIWRKCESCGGSGKIKKTKDCKYRFADWCGNPDIEIQEKCPECGGSGKVEYDDETYPDKMVDCDICGGSGKIKKTKDCKYRFADWCGNPDIEIQEKCPFAGVDMVRIHYCKDFEELESEVWSLVVRRFEKCPDNKNPKACGQRYEAQACGDYDSNCQIEQTFKVGETYKFALQTGKCEDCLHQLECMNLDKDCLPDLCGKAGESYFEPRIIERVVREEGLKFVVKGDNQSFNSEFEWINKANLIDGEYILLEVEVVK